MKNGGESRWKGLSTFLLSLSVPIIVAYVGWFFNQKAQFENSQYVRREEAYRQLINSLRGFYVDTNNQQLRSQFLEQVNLCWLYAPDEVIEKSYAFLATVSAGSLATELEQQNAVGKLILAIRQNMLYKDAVTETKLTSEDFKHLKANR